MILTEKVQVKRWSKGNYRKGRWEGGESSIFDLQCSMQPNDGEDLRKEVFGEQTREAFNLFSKQELLTSDEKKLQRADIVVYNGIEYEVVKVARWAGLIPHFKCLVLSLDVTEER